MLASLEAFARPSLRSLLVAASVGVLSQSAKVSRNRRRIKNCLWFFIVNRPDNIFGELTSANPQRRRCEEKLSDGNPRGHQNKRTDCHAAGQEFTGGLAKFLLGYANSCMRSCKNLQADCVLLSPYHGAEGQSIQQFPYCELQHWMEEVRRNFRQWFKYEAALVQRWVGYGESGFSRRLDDD